MCVSMRTGASPRDFSLLFFRRRKVIQKKPKYKINILVFPSISNIKFLNKENCSGRMEAIPTK